MRALVRSQCCSRSAASLHVSPRTSFERTSIHSCCNQPTDCSCFATRMRTSHAPHCTSALRRLRERHICRSREDSGAKLSCQFASRVGKFEKITLFLTRSKQIYYRSLRPSRRVDTRIEIAHWKRCSTFHARGDSSRSRALSFQDTACSTVILSGCVATTIEMQPSR